MKIEQIYTGCLAQGAYYVVSNNEAFIIDPLREVQPYLDRIAADGVKLKYIFETHFHADFVSGHLDLSKQTGAPIVYGPTAKTEFEAIIAEDGQVFEIGAVKIKVLHTPGHTMESTTFLLINEEGKDEAIFSGDTLFLGDVGRPDLAQHVIADLTERKLAAHLFDSLRNKIMPLADELIVYPNHGAGSACGKKMSKETTDTLGNQKLTNYALRADMTKDEFIEELLTGLTSPPGYFPKNVLMNIQGYDSLDTIMERGNRGLSPSSFELVANETNALILDTRAPEVFAQGFIPNSINIGLDGNFAMWVGEMISDIQQEILLVCEIGREEEAIIRLSRVGYDHTVGYLKGGFGAWVSEGRETDAVQRISAEEFAAKFSSKVPTFDVRKRSEFDAEHVVDVVNIPLNEINLHLAKFPENEPFILHCAGGYRSMIASSILKSRGIHHFVDVVGGMADISKTNVPKTAYVCPSTLL